jgi:hypothetical protein
MKKVAKQSDLYDLPNLGPCSVERLEAVGISSTKQLLKLGPEKAYDKLCTYYKIHMHMAFLYVLRAAVSFALEKVDREGALCWWMFRSPKDKEIVIHYKNKFNNKTPKKVVKNKK